MSDIVWRLRAYALDDHERGCQGRCYDCSCGYDGKRDPLLEEAAARIEQLEADQRDTTEEFGKLSHDLGKALLEATRLREANELMLTDIRRTDVDMLAFKARIEQLEAALRGVIGWLEDPEGGSHEEDMREASRIARAAFVAMVEAWPMHHIHEWQRPWLGGMSGTDLILPLTENPDDQA